MGKYINWRSIISINFIIFLGSFSTKAQRSDEIIRSGYYFVVQIDSIYRDTISFTTIEIYSPLPSLNLAKANGSEIQESLKSSFFINRSFSKGLLVGIKKLNIGNVMVLNTTIDNISNDGFIIFKSPLRPKKIYLKNMYRIRRN